MTSGPVVLQIPSDPAMSRVVRLTASSLATLANLSIDGIEDLKIVVSEVMGALIEHGDGADVTLKFEVGDQTVAVTGYTTAQSFVVDSPDVALSATVLAAIAAEHQIRHADEQLLIAVRYDGRGGGGSDA